MKKILLFEVVPEMRTAISVKIWSFMGIEIICAKDKQEASELFLLHKDTLDLVCLVGCAETRTKFDTADLVRLFLKHGFADRILGMSSIQSIRDELILCGGVRTCTKTEAPEQIKEMLLAQN